MEKRAKENAATIAISSPRRHPLAPRLLARLLPIQMLIAVPTAESAIQSQPDSWPGIMPPYPIIQITPHKIQ